MSSRWWDTCLLLTAKFWPEALLVIVVLTVIGFRSKGAVRVIVLSLAAIPVLWGAVVFVGVTIEEIEMDHDSQLSKESYARRHYEIHEPIDVDGLRLPAGTVITWRDDQKTELDEFYLRQQTVVLGATIIGYVKHEQESYIVTLAQDEDVTGWPCRAGRAQLGSQGDLWSCVLSREKAVSSPVGAEPMHLQAGTSLELVDGFSPTTNGRYGFTVSQDGSIWLPDVGERITGGGGVSLYRNGGEYSVYAPPAKPFTVRGIPFVRDVYFVYDPELAQDSNGPNTPPIAVRGQPGASMLCDGITYKNDLETFAQVNLRQNTVVFKRSASPRIGEMQTAPIRTAHCKMAGSFQGGDIW